MFIKTHLIFSFVRYGCLVALLKTEQNLREIT